MRQGRGVPAEKATRYSTFKCGVLNVLAHRVAAVCIVRRTCTISVPISFMFSFRGSPSTSSDGGTIKGAMPEGPMRMSSRCG